MRKCRFCREAIDPAAVVCPHCRRDLIPGRSTLDGAPQKVTVTGADPFAEYHTPIQGKKQGRITVVGYLGIGLGILMMVVAVASLPSARDDGFGSFMIGLLGVGFSVASYLWVRR